MTASHAFAFPNPIRLGPGVRHQLAAALAQAGASRPLVVTDRGIAPLAFFASIVEALTATGLAPGRYTGIEGNPKEVHVADGVAAYRAHDADAIVSVGGGAATDVAKAIGLMVNNPGSIFDYAEDAKTPRAPTAAVPWIVALPTTAGTGSEVGRSSVISDSDGRKRVVFQPVILPRLVLADPELLVGLPAHLTAATGVDALTHLVEAYVATGYHPMADGIALEGIRLIDAALARSVENPADLGARETMLMASMMGAVAFQKGLGICHAMAHALSAVRGTHHGLANAVLLPTAIDYNQTVCSDRFARIARALELEPTAARFADWTADLLTRLHIPESLTAIGFGEADLDALTALATRDGCMLTNPRTADAAAMRGLFAARL